MQNSGDSSPMQKEEKNAESTYKDLQVQIMWFLRNHSKHFQIDSPTKIKLITPWENISFEVKILYLDFCNKLNEIDVGKIESGGLRATFETNNQLVNDLSKKVKQDLINNFDKELIQSPFQEKIDNLSSVTLNEFISSNCQRIELVDNDKKIQGNSLKFSAIFADNYFAISDPTKYEKESNDDDRNQRIEEYKAKIHEIISRKDPQTLSIDYIKLSLQ